MQNSSRIPDIEVGGYRPVSYLGKGGMGTVYQAIHQVSGEVAAIKILFDPALAERFRNEAYIQSSVSHANITRLFLFAQAGGQFCILMEYVEGESLDEYIARKGGRLSNEETENILSQVIDALVHLHEKDIIHRDIKPQNFKIRRDGHVKMLDFGIAKHKYSPKLTQLGFSVGTTEYMAPEQFQSQVQKKSDIWSLGIMTYEMVTGFLPFDATGQVSLRYKIEKAAYTNPRVLVPQLSKKLNLLIERSLRPNPANRISALELSKIFSSSRAEETTPIRKITLPSIDIKKIWPYAAGALGVLLVFLMLRALLRDDEIVPGPKNVPGKITSEVKKEKIQIRVPSIPNAVITLPDGKSFGLPHAVEGTEGESVSFTIQADGYKELPVTIQITNRRSSYEYYLEKKN